MLCFSRTLRFLHALAVAHLVEMTGGEGLGEMTGELGQNDKKGIHDFGISPLASLGRNDGGRGSTERIMRRAERTKRSAGAITANRNGNNGGGGIAQYLVIAPNSTANRGGNKGGCIADKLHLCGKIFV